MEEFAPIAAALKKGQAATVDGAWNSSAALAAATLGLQAPKTLLIVLAHPRDLDPWAEDLVSFTGSGAVGSAILVAGSSAGWQQRKIRPRSSSPLAEPQGMEAEATKAPE